MIVIYDEGPIRDILNRAVQYARTLPIKDTENAVLELIGSMLYMASECGNINHHYPDDCDDEILTWVERYVTHELDIETAVTVLGTYVQQLSMAFRHHYQASGIFHVCHTLDTKREFAISTNSLFDYALLGSAVTELRIGYADDVYPSVVDAYYQYMDDPSLPFFDYKSGASGPISEFTDYG